MARKLTYSRKVVQNRSRRNTTYPYLGNIPIMPEIVQDSDSGIPAVANNDYIKKFFDVVADNLIKNLKK